MHAVGMLSSYISQSVYTVAGPFHPFGGAVDIIVVRQQDGTTKSSPWYVKFGKFQGVLKSREKIVDIAVNDVPTDFHMYLDHTGEAYFLKEPESDGEETVFSPPSASSSGDEIMGYNKRRIFPGQLTKSVLENATIKQGFEMPGAENRESPAEMTATKDNQGDHQGSLMLDGKEAEQVGVGTNTGVHSNKPTEVWDEAVNSISATGSGISVDEKLSKMTSEYVEDGSETARRGALKSSRSMLGLMFGSRSSGMSESLTSRGETGKEHAVGDLHRLSSIETAEIVADLVESRWGTGGSISNGPSISDLSSTHAGQVEVQLTEKVFRRNPVIINDLSISEVERPKQDEMEENSAVVEPFTKHMDEVQSNFAEGQWFLSTTEEQDAMVILFREVLDNCNMPKETEESSNSSHSRVQVANSMAENPVVQTTDNTNDEMIIMSFDGHIVSAPVLSDGEEFPIQAFDQGFSDDMLTASTSFQNEDARVAKSGDNTLVPPSGGWTLWPFTFRRSMTSEDTLSSVPNKAVLATTEDALQSPCTDELLQKNGYYSGMPKERVYVPTSQQLASLYLKDGPNKVTFTFSTQMLGKQQVDARIYMWQWNTRVVISDVDGTITKSDVLGQFMPLVGKDWTQSGVIRLFSGIKDNGYELLFLSARAIAQAYLTRQFLLNLKQDGETLPDGPVVISPDGLFPSLYREVIRRAPHEFKISCLEAIRELFPPDVNPFYAGFGNRDTDEISYLKVGIPRGKIFIINPKGEVVVNHRVDMRSYTSLHSLVDDMFPPISTFEEAYGEDLLMVQEDFNSWNYWKMPLPDIDVDLKEKRNQRARKGGDPRR